MNYLTPAIGDTVTTNDEYFGPFRRWVMASPWMLGLPINENNQRLFRRPAPGEEHDAETLDAVEIGLEKLNARRRLLNLPPVKANSLPRIPPHALHASDYYLVDTYSVRRHWRRRPIRTSTKS